jgi:hypothetical protein
MALRPTPTVRPTETLREVIARLEATLHERQTVVRELEHCENEDRGNADRDRIGALAG